MLICFFSLLSNLGPFSVKPLEKAGFVCPQLKYALRNPLSIAKQAQKIVQEGSINFIDGVLRTPIDTSAELNLIEGQLIKIDSVHSSWQEALFVTCQEIPHGKYGLFFIDQTKIFEDHVTRIEDVFSTRPVPCTFTGNEDTNQLKNWLLHPKKRENDFCIFGVQHQSNGIETEIVVHIYQADCPMCGISNADPVIVSRATAMVITATYQRLYCPNCKWNFDIDDGWMTPGGSPVETPLVTRSPSPELQAMDISTDNWCPCCTLL